MKIAIIGSGISGLTCAYLLNQKYDINLYEKNNYIGGHTHTHEIKNYSKVYNVDSGFIVFNEDTYPNFIKLLNLLDVETEKTTMGFSVKSINQNLEYAGNSISSLFAQKSNLFRFSFWWMLIDILKFNKRAKIDIRNLSPNICLDEYLDSYRFSNSFKNNYIYPMGSAIWSTNSTSMKSMSALFFLKFFNNHGLLKIFNRSQWYVISGGSNQYIKKMIKQFESKIFLNTEVKSILRVDNKVEILSETYGLKTYDAVIIASHSDQALKILSDPTTLETEILGSISYQENTALLHTDISVLPKRKNAWSSWNYNLDQNPNDPMAMTYNMNILQNLESETNYCVTLNSNEIINNQMILKKLKYAHPLLNIKSSIAQLRRNEISGKDNTYYCGAYWYNGFHEDGVVSALDVCKNFGVEL